jgi:hypothetical protein
MDTPTITPDTLSYLYLGLAAIAAVLIIFIASLVIRYRNLQKDAETIMQLSEDN